MKYTDRHKIWATVDEMDKALVDNWNAVVHSGDEIFIVGDFCWKDHGRFLQSLKGSKYLIKGSHDKMGDDVKRNFAGIYTELVVPLTETRKVLLHHTVLRIWEKSHYGQAALHGHSHGRLTTFNLSRDCGVDCEDAAYTPFRASYLAEWFDRRELEMKQAGRIVTDEKTGRTLYRSDDVSYLMEQLNGRRSEGHT